MLLKSGLYIVSTPIGNLEDITLRGLATLKNSSVILCEDTRISQKLLAKHGIKGKLQVYNDHSDEGNRKNIIGLIEKGNIVSLISDAGTPLISDPGYKLVRELQLLGYHVDIAPGVSSVIASLTLSGLPTDRFLFCGFLPKTIESKKKIFNEFKNIRATLVFFDTAVRMIDSLVAAREILNNREICVARELTKRYQQIKTAHIDKVIEFYQNNPLKGEIVLLISGIASEEDNEKTTIDLQAFIKSSLENNLSAKTTTDLAYENFSNSYSRKEIYKIVNQMK